MIKFQILILVLLLTKFCRAQDISNDIHYYTFWEFYPNDTNYIFIDQARIRATPQLNGLILDSLTIATPVIIEERTDIQNYIRGNIAPWYRIRYSKNNRTQFGYIWGGMLALNNKRTNQEGLLFLSGIYWANYKSSHSTGKYYWMGIKVINAQKKTISNKEFAFPSFDQSFVDAKIYSNKGLVNTTNIYSLGLISEACGIPTNVKYFSWYNNTLTEIIETTTVSDAGVYYYDEEVQFPTEHRGNAQLVVKKIEESEVDENKYSSKDGPYYKTKKKTQKYLWDGKSLKAIK